MVEKQGGDAPPLKSSKTVVKDDIQLDPSMPPDELFNKAKQLMKERDRGEKKNQKLEQRYIQAL